jgi:hypothetical protein
VGKSRRQSPSKGVKAKVVRQCGVYERQVAVRKLASEKEVASARPAARAALWDWIQFHGQLRAWLWTQDFSAGDADAEEVILQAMNDHPKGIQLLTGKFVYVHPKSLSALMWFRERDWFLDWCRLNIEVIREAMVGGPASVEALKMDNPQSTLERLSAEIGYQCALLCEAAITEGPTIPADLEPSQEMTDLSPVDYLRLLQAFLDVNGGRLNVLERVAPRTKPGGKRDRPSWNIFLANLGMRLKKHPAELAKDHSLASLVGLVRLSVRENSDLMED